MTTIAYKDGIIATDGRMATDNDGTLISDCYPKVIQRNGVYFFIAGPIAWADNLMSSYLGEAEPNIRVAVNAVVADGDKIFYIGINPEADPPYLWKEPVLPEIPDSWGSGRDHALTAFDFGVDAVTAIKCAAKRDLYTGGQITTFNMKTKKVEIIKENI